MPVPQPPIKYDYKARDTTDRDGEIIRKIVIHATAGTDSRKWLSGNENGTSIHVLIMKDGTSYKMCHESIGTNHVGYSKMVIGGVVYSRFNNKNCNQITLGIELENLNNGRDPYPEAQLRACAWWIQEWLKEQPQLTHSDVIMHRHIDTQGKTDARNLEVTDILRFLDEAATSDTIKLSLADSLIVAPAMGTPELAAKYLTLRKTDPSYSAADHKIIATYYYNYGEAVGINPLMAFAQMIHETGGLTSWWSLRPRRNPAGIGVTGETSRSRIRPPSGPGLDWQADDISKLWKKGFAFTDWQLAVKAHLGHLIVYAVNPGMQSPTQRAMVAFDPRAVVMPLAYKGTSRVWNDLEGKWAVPGNNYSNAIANIASGILKV